VGQSGIFRLLNAKTFEVIKSYDPLEVSPSAIAWDGQTLWSCDRQTNKIYRHVMDSWLSVDISFDYLGQEPVGMTWQGEVLWIADGDSGSVYKLVFNGNIFTLAGRYHLDNHRPGEYPLSGITWDGTNLWTISEGRGKIFRHTIKELSEI